MPASLFPSSSGGPVLPASLDTLLVLNGRPAMPIHLCLSVLRDAPLDTRVLLITSSRYSWHDALVELNDQWLHERGSNNDVAHLLSRVDVFHPASHKHWEVLLAAMRLATPDDPQLASPFILASLPAMLVICEPSHYFMDEERGHGVLSEYVSLITSALALSQYLSRSSKASRRPPVVVFDSYLDALRLPVLRAAQLRVEETEDSIQQRNPRMETVLPAVERYFQWTSSIDTVSPEEEGGSDGMDQDSEDGERSTTYRITFRCRREGKNPDPVSWTWSEGQKESTVPEAPASTTVNFSF